MGPPFLHWSSNDADQVEKGIKIKVGETLLVRRIDANIARNLTGLGKELGKAIGRPIVDNQDALDDVMGDVYWLGGAAGPAATVYVVENAAAILRDLPAGMAMWGTKAEGWARAWATPVRDGESWNHDPIPLHFIHCTDKMPRNAPNMNRFEIDRP